MKQLIFSGLFVLAAWPVYAASFDCGKATSAVEKLVCTDPELSSLDDEVNAAYEAALKDHLKDPEHALLLLQERMFWRNWRRGEIGCFENPGHPTTVACLKLIYQSQLSWVRRPYFETTRLTVPGLSARAIDSAIPLRDGKVVLLVRTDKGFGGYVYDSHANRLSEIAYALTPGRFADFAVPLDDGRVLLAGGWDYHLGYSIEESSLLPEPRAELYEPATQGFTLAGSIPPTIKGSATLLRNGKILLAGGSAVPPFIPSRNPYYFGPGRYADPKHGLTYSRDAVLFDPATGKSVPTGRLGTARTLHSAITLADGGVLVFGGSDGTKPVNAEIYDPATGAFTATGAPIENRIHPGAILLPDGKVLVIGGLRQWSPWPPKYSLGDVLDTAELYDPVTGQFSETGRLHRLEGEWMPIRLPNGKVLVVGGRGDAEYYDPDKGEFTPSGKFRPGMQTATLLKNGKLLLMYDDSAELYDFAPASAASKRSPDVAKRNPG